MDEKPEFTVVIRPSDGRETRAIRIGNASLRRIVAGAVVLGVLFALVLGSWWYLAARAQEATRLTAQVEGLTAELERMDELARTLTELERRYEGIRSLFGPAQGIQPETFLPPALGRGSSLTSPGAGGDGRPTSWPLTERGFLTQPLIEGGGSGEEHPGIDIAVPAGSYIRSAGDGSVVEVGDDPVYGLYLIVDHGGGYRSLYAHASQISVEHGRTVRRNQVLGLTGSTGRSTAPHLHFEILRDGEPVDPLEIVERP
ncbi:MAG: hypothetical protein EA351_04080 [Gemmatimonadales bacterium]|nr:MAG: hypothetical protein EA351_04080 [Gemmatimonadales bacterium]